MADDDTTTLRARIEELKQHLQELQGAYEAERQIAAFELHDGLVQYLTGALLQLESIDPEQLVTEQARGSLAKAIGLVREAIAEGRHMLGGLAMPQIDERGLGAAVEGLVKETRGEGVPVEYHSELPNNRLDRLAEQALYRIAQESLTNVRRHSGAVRARVELIQHADRIRLVVQDWGRGFNPAAVPQHRFGLLGIRRRAELAGGRAEIHSAPGNGTTVTVELPLN